MAVTLSQIRTWSTEHLTNAASYWTQTADRWEDTFLTMRNQSHSITWHGAGGDTLRQRTGADYTLVSGKADELRQAAGIARSGASDISAAKQRALHAVEDAQNAGFDVGEDLSVSYPDHGGTAAQQAAKQAQAEKMASEIWSRAAQLEGADQKVAGQLTAATAGLGKAGFASGGNEHKAQLADFTRQDGSTQTDPNPQGPIDPRNPLIGDERFGHWVNVVPPPYVGKDPPPPATGHRSLEGFPGKGPAGPSGFYVPGGKPWADDNAPPFAYIQEQYRFRITGEDYTSYTRMVNGQQQQWVQYSYEAQRYTQVSFGGDAWAPKGANPVTKEPGGVISGGLAGINPPPKISPWQPITLNQIGSLSAANPDVTYYIPNGCGGQFTFSGGVPVGGIQPPPSPPIMIAGK
ncbi:hypothetical protein [Mycolicibacterium vulneris]|uniref:hypothetical protein n=1 Tax=Mycolicibacterium vulneris TaxID=547163 RepID=UPI001FE88DC5|nr:hypothetical protein [Mycolicibacterium vulneris]